MNHRMDPSTNANHKNHHTVPVRISIRIVNRRRRRRPTLYVVRGCVSAALCQTTTLVPASGRGCVRHKQLLQLLRTRQSVAGGIFYTS
jgi:hypothetical protein